MNKLLHHLPLTALLAQVAAPGMAQSTQSSVVGVGDGDTLRVQSQGKIEIIRLGCIDSPELAQKPWGEQVRKRLLLVLPNGQAVQVREIERERPRRMFQLVPQWQQEAQKLASLWTQTASKQHQERLGSVTVSLQK